MPAERDPRDESTLELEAQRVDVFTDGDGALVAGDFDDVLKWFVILQLAWKRWTHTNDDFEIRTGDLLLFIITVLILLLLRLELPAS